MQMSRRAQAYECPELEVDLPTRSATRFLAPAGALGRSGLPAWTRRPAKEITLVSSTCRPSKAISANRAPPTPMHAWPRRKLSSCTVSPAYCRHPRAQLLCFLRSSSRCGAKRAEGGQALVVLNLYDYLAHLARIGLQLYLWLCLWFRSVPPPRPIAPAAPFHHQLPGRCST